MPDAQNANNSRRPSAVDKSRHTHISYWFLGKIALFPIIMVFLAAGAVSLLTFKTGLASDPPPNTGPGLTGFFSSNDLSYGLVGLILSILCAILLIFFLFWSVIRITFIFDAQDAKFTVLKRGIFRYVLISPSLLQCTSSEVCLLHQSIHNGLTVAF